MKTINLPVKRVHPLIMGIAIVIVLGFTALVAYRLISGKPLGLRSFVRDQVYRVLSPVRMLGEQGKVNDLSNGSFVNILFVHQSVGAGIIKDGHLRELLSQKGYALYDQGYRQEGLWGPDGNWLGYSYNIPNDDTDPDDFFTLFSQQAYQTPINGLSQVLQHEVIILKSCFPNNNIDDEQQLEALKTYYLGIRDSMDKHSDRLFILLTTPPLNPAETNAENAARARTMANWLKSEAFKGERENLAVFDLFDSLAEPDGSRPDANMLRESYRVGADSHPNARANENVAKSIAAFVDDRIATYRQAGK